MAGDLRYTTRRDRYRLNAHAPANGLVLSCYCVRTHDAAWIRQERIRRTVASKAATCIFAKLSGDRVTRDSMCNQWADGASIYAILRVDFRSKRAGRSASFNPDQFGCKSVYRYPGNTKGVLVTVDQILSQAINRTLYLYILNYNNAGVYSW